MTVIFISESPFIIPNDYDPGKSCLVEAIGAGQLGVAAGNGGAGADYAALDAPTLLAGQSVPVQIGATDGADTWFMNTATLLARGGGSASVSVGSVVHAGGAGSHVVVGKQGTTFGKGGGAGGPDAAGSGITANGGHSFTWTQDIDGSTAKPGNGGQAGGGSPPIPGSAGQASGGGGGTDGNAGYNGAVGLLVFSYNLVD